MLDFLWELTHNRYGQIRDWAVAALALLGIGVFVGVVTACIIYGGRAYGRPQCARWGVQTGYPTKFVILGWADGGTCLARTKSGRWVLNTQVRAFEAAR